MTHTFYRDDTDGGGGGILRTRSRAAIAAICVASGAIAAVVGVHGNFPLSDDWAYAHAARSLYENGSIDLLPWTGASILLQAAYGAALTALFGFSFTVLRISTLVIAVGGVVALYLVLRECGARAGRLALGVAVVALNPLYVNLSFTFMTDVPFTALVLWAAYLYARGLDHADRRALLGGSACAAAALLVRQHGIFVAIAASVGALRGGKGTRERVVDSITAGVVPALTLTAYLAWLYLVHGEPAAVSNKVGEAAHAGLAGTLNIVFRALETVGLLLAPIAATATTSVRRAPKTFLITVVALASCAAFLYLREGALMFYLTNVLYDFGLGALTLRDVLFLGMPPPAHLGRALGLVLTVVSTLSMGALIVMWSQALPRRGEAGRTFLWLAFVLLLAGSLLHSRFYFDRYLLPIVPFAAVLALLTRAPLRVGPAAYVVTAVLAWYAVAGTHDYMAWNRARYSMLDTLENEGVDARSIDGGMEYNAWRLAARLGTWPTRAQVEPGQAATTRSWWWVVDDTFVVSFRPLDGYAPKAQVTYPQWLVPRRGRVLLMERERSSPRE